MRIPMRLLLLTTTMLFTYLRTSNGLRLDTEGTGSPCYETSADGSEDLEKPQKCMPAFENVVAGKSVSVSPPQMTCGLRSVTEYCIQTHGIYRECDLCDDRVESKRHPSLHLTDIHEDFNPSWWQSVTMLEDIHMVDVNLTVNLGKAYDITYVRVKFRSPRPASFAIYKKNRRHPAKDDPTPDQGWIPWQYYSATCRDTYQIPDSPHIIQPRGDAGQSSESSSSVSWTEARALCTSEFSDLAPLTGGNVAFSTLEGRPSALNFEYSPELQDWVSATDIRISLQRLNTFGDEVFGDPKVLRSYYYAITDFTVGGRCQCNGHATHCIANDDEEGNTSMTCLCQHGTDGNNCQTCLPDHWDLPWRRATSNNANECRPCECNGWSSVCQFNEALYSSTGHGGQCLNCGGNRDGPHCETCKANHYFDSQPDAKERIPCQPCNCDPVGSVRLQCAPDGQCECKSGVTGAKCDMCANNFWDLSNLGCTQCGCLKEGSVDNEQRCDELSGECFCKSNVEGQRCDRCKAGHFHIDLANEFGCTPCFCYGHTSECERSPGYVASVITSDFSRGHDNWLAFDITSDHVVFEKSEQWGNEMMHNRELPLRYDAVNKVIGAQADVGQTVYFSAPEAYLGDQRASYNQKLRFKLRINDVGPRPSMSDVVIVGGGARPTSISLSITDQGNAMPSFVIQDYEFVLHESPEYQWSPRLSSKDFMAILANVTSFRVRATYVDNGMGFLDEVVLGTAVREERANSNGMAANWIEMCDCPQGYGGQFCEMCTNNFFHENNGGPFARCVPCACNNHAQTCHPESGVCACEHNTDGVNCERCGRGFFGNALSGSADACKPCPCPESGPCLEIPGQTLSPICIECPQGRTGPRCELCEDGYFGDPQGQQTSIVTPCTLCDCNNNVDANAIGNCNRTTGQCLRCVDNTDGFNCERCKSGFFGDALALKQPGDPPSCQPCQCYPVGTVLDEVQSLPVCNGYTGDCRCKPHVVGRDCDTCTDGFFNLDSGQGCEACNCDSFGAINATCHIESGQCHCRPGVTGQHCDMCLPNHFGFGADGCRVCDCDPNGSTDLQCDAITGQCPCRDKVEGRRCDRCEENTKSRELRSPTAPKICEPCDDCYNLIAQAVKGHREELRSLDDLLQDIRDNPEPVGQDFEYQLRQLQVRVKATLADARISSQSGGGGGGGDGDNGAATLRDRLEALRLKLQSVIEMLVEADGRVAEAKAEATEAQLDADDATSIIEQAKVVLKSAQRELRSRGKEALRQAEVRAAKFGEENAKMSQMAREARTLAEQHVEDASEIASIAKQAYNASAEAYAVARDALEQQHYTANRITILQVQVGDTGEKLRRVQSLASQTLRDSTQAYEEALKIYQQAYSLDMPDVDTAAMAKQAERVNKEASRIRQEADQLIQVNQQLLSETQDERVQLEDMLERAVSQQQTIDAQLADVDGYRARALEAVKTGDNVLNDARNTLETLRDFEASVKSNEEAAMAALAEADSVTAMLTQAEERTRAASEAMADADVSATLASNVALDAAEIAEAASNASMEISNQARDSLDEAIDLNAAATALADKLDEIEAEVADKEAVAADEADAALKALERANQAQNKAGEATRKVEQAKKELEDIVAILSAVEEPDPELLEELTARVAEAEVLYSTQNVEQQLRELQERKLAQEEQIREMSRQLEYLQEETQNVVEIRDSLPNFCPKSNELCLEDQC